MSDTCIVCLGDLGEGANDLPLPLVLGVEVGPEGTTQDEVSPDETSPNDDTAVASKPSTATGVDLIAHLLPCGHNLHDECLKPWVERANSCPICRQNFNQVELSATIGGSVISSYAVSDRVQVADQDPSVVLEDYDDPESAPCPVCGNGDHEEVLILCDGCDMGYHTYCVDLDSVPVGRWFCADCELNRALEPTIESTRAHSYNASNRRTRAQRRRAGVQALTASSHWARVWQSVWDHLNIDLDFPHESPSTSRNVSAGRPFVDRRRNYRAWERRLQVAESQGGTNRFRDTASALIRDHPIPSRPRPEPPEPESVDELLAWNAMEKARDIDADPTPKMRKRKSTTNSPSEADPTRRRKKRKETTTSPTEVAPPEQIERPLKRPQTRRVHNVLDASSDSAAESSAPRRLNTAAFTNDQGAETGAGGAGPSFLQSLLKEVETSAASEEDKGPSRPSLTLPFIASSDHSSPRYSSPGASPTASNHPSPRAASTTPPPYFSTRPGSPVPLTSKVEPVYPPPEFSPERSPPPEPPLINRPNRASLPLSREIRSRPRVHSTSDSSRTRSQEASPTRMNMSLSAKSNIQKMVKDALKSPYKNGEINKDQYTEINRSVSRMLYDAVGESANLSGEATETWRRMAVEEVNKAVHSL
ncbi:hypothetical protein MMC30_007161 [Trapelia coarctata]|nr:hypothetical protein [Trapelia coarctata]